MTIHRQTVKKSLLAGAFVLPLTLAGGALAATAVTPGQSIVRAPSVEKTEEVRLIADSTFWPLAHRLLSSRGQGLMLLDRAGKSLAAYPGAYSTFDYRSGSEGLIVAALDTVRQQITLFGLTSKDKQFKPVAELPRTAFAIEAVCLYKDAARNVFAFLVGEEGIGEQWLVADRTAPLSQPRQVRRLSLPPESKFCHVDDQQALFYVNEESVGLWAYPADAEAPLTRQAVDMVKPFGKIAGSVGGVAAVPGGVVAVDPESSALHRYLRQGKGWQALPPVALAGMKEPEQISATAGAQGLELSVLDEDGVGLTKVGWKYQAAPAPTALPILPARVQTEPVPGSGDAADDPAIWVHPDDPRRSRVLGTDKQGGLLVYDLEGKVLQDLRVGRINNVDLRAGWRLGAQLVDVAVGTNRDHDSLHVFTIDRQSGVVSELGQIAMPLKDVYGMCMFKDRQDNIYAIANGKDGTFLQYRLNGTNAKLSGQLVRRFKVGSQPEGCVADDRKERLFVGEEKEAVWTLDARADAPTTMTKVIGVGKHVKDDIEGLAIYRGVKKDYLVISSQGNDSYVILDADAPFTYRGAFRIGLNAKLGIDGASETDGLDVTSANLGGPWAKGMLVVQDGRKRMPEANQNYKYLPWSDIAEALGLE